jgi:hypothetical protein
VWRKGKLIGRLPADYLYKMLVVCALVRIAGGVCTFACSALAVACALLKACWPMRILDLDLETPRSSRQQLQIVTSNSTGISLRSKQPSANAHCPSYLSTGLLEKQIPDLFLITELTFKMSTSSDLW